MAKKKDTKVLMTRNLIIGFSCVIAILVLGFGTYLSTGIQDTGEAAPDEDYIVLEDASPRRPGAPIEVIEFFSYRCGACKNFEPILSEWVEDLPEGVRFRRQHVIFSPIDELFAKTHIVLDETDSVEQNHSRLFTAVQDQGRQFLTPEMVADFVDGRGVDKAQFIRKFENPEVKRRAQRAETDQVRMRVVATPTLVVAGKYVVGMNKSQRRALVVASQLIERELAPAPPG